MATKTEKNIFIAFVFNLLFSIIELVGGIFTRSVSIQSDAVHDFGDAASIGLSFIFEKKSKRAPDEHYTYGYGRFSVLGGAITCLILFLGSAIVIYNAVQRILHPVEIRYDGMLFFAVIGLSTNLLAAYFTHGGNSVNQKAVHLHMLEDVLGWFTVLVGAIVMRFTHFLLLDPIMSILTAVFILGNTVKNFQSILDIFLLKAPKSVNIPSLKAHLLQIEGVEDAHHIHLWTVDGECFYATAHIIVKAYGKDIKKAVKEELREHGIFHSVLELETAEETCLEKTCTFPHAHHHGHHHHH